MADQDTRTEINRLYWESDESVGAIADRVGVSRRALYDSIDPLPAGARCEACGGALGFRNRTTAERREAECAECGAEAMLPAEPQRAARFDEPQVEQEEDAGPLAPLRPLPEAGRAPVLGGAMLAGMAMGAVAGYLLRRR